MMQSTAVLLRSRIVSAFLAVPPPKEWLPVGYVLSATAAVALPLGFRTKFLELRPVMDASTVLKGAATALLVPGISEEVLFRAALLPHPKVDPSMPPSRFALAAVLPLTAFVAYHLINPDRRARTVFWDPRFLSLAGVLGTACTTSYYLTRGSLAAAAVTHWVPVCIWLFALGGWQKVHA